MDAVKFMNEARRMCFSHDGYCEKGEECPAVRGSECLVDIFAKELDPEEAVRIVEEWSKAHPRKTNADKFKEVFGKEPVVILRDIANDYGEWLYAPYEAPKGAE